MFTLNWRTIPFRSMRSVSRSSPASPRTRPNSRTTGSGRLASWQRESLKMEDAHTHTGTQQYCTAKVSRLQGGGFERGRSWEPSTSMRLLKYPMILRFRHLQMHKGRSEVGWEWAGVHRKVTRLFYGWITIPRIRHEEACSNEHEAQSSNSDDIVNPCLLRPRKCESMPSIIIPFLFGCALSIA